MAQIFEEEKRQALTQVAQIFEEEKRQALTQAVEKEQEKGIQHVIEVYQEMGGTISEAVEGIILKYGLPKEASSILVTKYWK